MRNFIGIDVASEVCSVVTMTEKGRLITECNIPTTAENIRQIVKGIRRPRTVVFEECCQAAWLYSILEPYVDDVFVCDPRKNKSLSGHSKSDRNDAFNLAERARGGHLSRVWHGGEKFQELRNRLRLYQALTQESTAVKNKMKAVFRSRGLRVGAVVYNPEQRQATLELLPLQAHKERVSSLGEVLDAISEQRSIAEKMLIRATRSNAMYKSLMSIPQIGEIRAATIIAEVGTPSRFRSRKQFWSYIGLAVTTYESSQYTLDDRGRVRAKDRKVRTRGLVKNYNRELKGVFKQAAFALSRGEWKHEFDRLLKAGVAPNNALLTLARKIAAIALHLMKTGEEYDETLVFPRK